MKTPDFTPEQLAYLADILRPRCCHVTGMHSPTHWREDPAEFCDRQQADAWERAVEALGLSFDRAPSKPTCGWCGDAREKAATERMTGGRPHLGDVLTKFAAWSLRPTPTDGKSEYVAHYRGARYGASFKYRHSIQSVEHDVSWIHLTLPRFDPTTDIPADGHPKEKGALTDEEKAAILLYLTDMGATVVTTWGGKEWFSIALECGAVKAEQEAAPQPAGA
jgi:hypothetical protein